ncbi:MAG: ATP-binding protein [Desulfobacterales bacterium]
MTNNAPAAGRPQEASPAGGAARGGHYTRLFWRFIALTVLCSLVPLLLVGWGINLHYSRFARERMLDFFQSQVEDHRRVIERFLGEQTAKLQLVARTHDLARLTAPGALERVFALFNQEERTLTDLGVIGKDGLHRAYVGPYDLWSRNYSREHWFQRVMERGVYVSDMFMGFRREPHFIIAVTHADGEDAWILRATIHTEAFRALVENVRIGRTGMVYLLNAEGLYQTSPRGRAAIMERAPYPVGEPHPEIRLRTIENATDPAGKPLARQIACEAWLKAPRWLLVVQQDHDEAFADVNHANRWTLIFLLVSAATIVLATVGITRHMIGLIRRRDAEAERLNEQLLQAGKLAAIGELSAGVAHEINNPLAILLTERQLLLDCAARHPLPEGEFREQFEDSMNQIDVQVQRCKRITQNLLRFARRTESKLETLDVNAFVREVIELMEREAKTSGIRFTAELDPALPPVVSDPSQLQQVLLNLFTNAIDAHEEKPYGAIRITTRADSAARRFRLHVADTGRGIRPEHLPRIFDPFFTTKAVGKGTGLGLAITYGIVQRLGGTIRAASEPGKGTEFTIELPYEPPQDLRHSLADRTQDA